MEFSDERSTEAFHQQAVNRKAGFVNSPHAGDNSRFEAAKDTKGISSAASVDAG
jgi:hypothetical protein